MADILLADDEEELLELVRFSLDAAGYNVTAVKNGKLALEESQKKRFDLIVLDVMMPIMDGYHAAAEINQDPNSPPILLLTSRDFDQDQAAIKGSGASAFLSKPFEVSELLETVRGLLNAK
ncbi:MAG: Alkaline phosphatase synthesis transcriptional regulatory protein PhoP [Elusimicrobia bacterium]|nr:Alkaline phosphatase synthesis transcriptional regulatory protein PhoP [Elusimicrobiota bacterium]